MYEDGVRLRDRFAGEAVPAPCDFGCGGSKECYDPNEPLECFAERDFFDPAAEKVARAWNLAGGRERRAGWPSGTLNEEDAAVVFYFTAIDGLVANAEARMVKEKR